MRVAVLVAAIVAALGCGAGSSATNATPATNLTITVWPEGRAEGDALRWTLRCEPVGGTLRRAATACDKLEDMTNPFAPQRRTLVCTDQYGGPQQAIVAGTFEGKRTWIALAARNGCEISRWKRLAFLVPGAPGTGAS
ncbi:MAG: SSI family serine proteinase inhibitor [Gaiellaceae bacterium]